MSNGVRNQPIGSRISFNTLVTLVPFDIGDEFQDQKHFHGRVRLILLTSSDLIVF